MDVFSAEWFGFQFADVPHFVLIGLVMIAVFHKRSTAIVLAVSFGLLTDIIYTNVLGVYGFCLPITVYLVTGLNRLMHMNIFVIFFMAVFSVAILEMGVYEIYSLIGNVNMDFSHFWTVRMPPVLILNGVALILLFYPLRNLILKLKNREEDE